MRLFCSSFLIRVLEVSQRLPRIIEELTLQQVRAPEAIRKNRIFKFPKTNTKVKKNKPCGLFEAWSLQTLFL